MAEHETIADIVAEMRNRAKRPDFVSQDVLKSCADRLEAAHRREVQNALDAGGFVEASRKNEQVGNAAKLREAALAIRADILKRRSENCWYATDSNILEKIDAALAAPPRNCERFQTTKQAKEAYCAEVRRVFVWDGCETERLVDWLLAPATEKEGDVV